MINVGVFGYGTVGSGVVSVISENADVIKKNVGEELKVKAILDLRDFPGDPFEKLIVHDVQEIIDDDSISIICETMGGVGPAYAFTKQALMKGKSVCTSNKELVALHGPELIAIAKANNCSYKFEASVGGGIPIIRPLLSALTADRIEKVMGIVNGTTNYMLTKMSKENADFDEVLREAQLLGYAELHPEADVEGYDAARKLAILSSLLYGKTVKYEDIHTEGITKISARDFRYAKQLKKNIKLVAKFEGSGNEAYALVAPHMLGESNPLSTVNDVFNAILVHGNMLDDAMFYGRGAGKLPTASAVCGDVVECAKNIGHHLPIDWADEEVKLTGFENSKKAFFVRVGAELKEEAAKAFKDAKEINVGFYDEYAFITDEMTECEFEEKKNLVGTLINYIRIEE